jgi:hypothetical protein
MGNYNPKITISSAPGILDNIIVALAEATNPSVYVAFQILNPPHNASVQCVFTGLNPVMHNVTIFETSGTSPGGTVRANFALDPKYPTINLKLPVFAHAGTYPGFPSGGNTLTDASFIGWQVSDLQIRGVGPMEPLVEYSYDITTGIITELQAGYATGDGELWVIYFEPQVVTQTPISGASSIWSSVKLITADTALTTSDLGSCCLIQAAIATAPIITLPALSLMPDNKPFYFLSDGGSHLNAILRAAGVDKILYNGLNTDFVLGQSESVWLFSYTDLSSNKKWLAINVDANIKSVGEIIYNYRKTEINTIFADGSTYFRNQYPRLWNEIQKLDITQLISDATWLTGNSNRGYYSTGDGSSTFRVPNLFLNGFIRAVDSATRKAGNFQASGLGAVTAKITGFKIQKSGSSNQIIAVGNINDANLGTAQGGNVIIDDGAGELRTNNVGTYALIRI